VVLSFLEVSSAANPVKADAARAYRSNPRFDRVARHSAT
jgi:hypothetical protein